MSSVEDRETRRNRDGSDDEESNHSGEGPSLIDLVEVTTRRKLMELEIEFEANRDKLQWEIEDKTEERSNCNSSTASAEIEKELRQLQRTLERLNVSHEKNKRQVSAVGELEKQQVNLERDLKINCRLEYNPQDNSAETERLELEKGHRSGYVTPSPLQNNPDSQFHHQRQPTREQLPLHSTPSGFGGNPQAGGVMPDKDTIMMQLMQTQMHFLQRNHGSYTDRKLPEFSGDPSDWGSFRSALERTQKKYNFEDCENLARLEKALKGKSRESVKHLMSNPNNLRKIIEVLEQRFGRAEFVIDYLMERARTCKKPDESKPESVVEFGTAVDDLVANICAYDEQEYMHNKQLVLELVEKLPLQMKGRWFRWMNEDKTRKTNLINFSTWLTVEVEIAILQVKPKIDEKKTEEKSSSKQKKTTGSVNTSEGDDNSKSICSVCKISGHAIDTCWKLKKKSMDERWNLVKEAKVCFGCLKPGHSTKECKEAKECGKDGCTWKHHYLLHSSRSKEKPNKKPESDGEEKKSDKPASSSSGEKAADGTISVMTSESLIEGTDGPLPIVPVRIKGKHNRQRVVYALLDSGATRTLVTQDLADSLKLEGKQIKYSYRTMSGAVITNKDAKKVDFQLSGKYRNARMWPITDAVTVTKIGLAPYSIDVEKAKLKWPHLRRYKGPSLVKVTPEIIIGGDNGYLLMHKELLYSTLEEPVAMRTTLGWILQGKLTDTNMVGSSFGIGGVPTNAMLDDLIKQSFKLETYGVTGDEKKMSLQDKRALEIMESTTIKRKDGRWETGLLWKDDLPFPENTYDQAYMRLCKTETRMMKSPDFAMVYHKKIQEYLDKKYIRKLNAEEARRITKRTCFIPHFGVVNPNKPGKFRLVFDAAAKTGGVSMNDRLLTGPDLLRPLPAVLWNFRRHPVVICGDIEDMFHIVYIRDEDRKAQQFLWRNGDSGKNPEVYQMEVMMIFGATSSPSSAIFVKDRNAEDFAEKYPDAVAAIKTDMYCDDFLSGAPTVKAAIKLREEVTVINAEGGFIMKKWISNNEAVMDSIPDELRLDGNKPLSERGILNSASERVLGLWWDPGADEFTFRLNFNKVDSEVMRGRRPTKREMCSLLMSLFDPLGFVAHFKIKGLILFQQVWRSGIDWDDFITEEVYEGWKTWLAELQEITGLRISRCYSMMKVRSVQLHTMVDASSEAISSVCYLRLEGDSGVEVVFVSAKTRVAPLKKSTIPRLELEAAVIGSKLASTILKDLKLKVDKCYFWSDSSTVLSWIRSESSRFREYVANRISKIQELTNPADWRWVGTDDNAADDGTRVGRKTDLQSDCRWLRGPEFLRMEEDKWPRKISAIDNGDGVQAITALEDLEDASGISSSTDDGCGLGAVGKAMEVIPSPERFSNYYRLLRATASVVSCARYWKSKIDRKNLELPPWKKNNDELESRICPADLFGAEKILLRAAQADVKLQVRKKTKYEMFRADDEIIRIKGRLEKAQCVGESTKTPVYLPAKNYIADLIISDEHKKNGHTGRNTVYNNLRQKYWIQDGRQAVRRAWSRCYYCRLRKAKPVHPEMGTLPVYRVASFEPPFSYTGADMFGPFEVTVGRRHEKRWGLLLTCMVTRAVHLEITAGLSADDTLLALSRFVDTRGLPRHFYSDNGTNFVAVAKEMKKRQKYHTSDWHFIPAASPHMGGAWESMVKQVKAVLANLLKEKYPRDQVAQTAFKAVENIVNSRPLAYVSGDPDDPEALTPNHFLRGIGIASGDLTSQAAVSGSTFVGHDVQDDRERWGKLWEKAQVMANKFWERWSKEVLPDLLRKDKWNVATQPIKLGEVVIIVDEQKPRNSWLKAIVTETFPGSDGIIRVVEVTTRLPESGTKSTYRRAVTKVCPTGIVCCDCPPHEM